nr:VP1 {SL variant, broad host range, internal fragment} [foot-and-mouth disease virus FMDV, subtype A12, 119, Peptide Partial, 20 aa] [Foot-and-mouth disease virus]
GSGVRGDSGSLALRVARGLP